MTDIMKFIRSGEAAADDPQGHLLQEDEWSESRARELAEEQGIELGDEHLAVALFVRDHYRQHGVAGSARELLDAMSAHFDAEGGKKYLYKLFPGGPVNQSSRIAGLPVPGHSSDPSFGVAS